VGASCLALWPLHVFFSNVGRRTQVLGWVVVSMQSSNLNNDKSEEESHFGGPELMGKRNCYRAALNIGVLEPYLSYACHSQLQELG
jgi:hypothetical protein